MANVNSPMGLQPVCYLNGSPWNGQARVYCIPATDSTNAYAVGDPVKSAGSADANGIPTVTLAAAGDPIRGIIVGTGVNPLNLNSTIIPQTKTKDYYVLVADDPNILYEVQEVGTGTSLTASEIGLNANLVAGTNNGYVSGWMLDNSSEATTETLQVRLMGLMQRPGNSFGPYAKHLVLINSHELRAGTAGV